MPPLLADIAATQYITSRRTLIPVYAITLPLRQYYAVLNRIGWLRFSSLIV